MMAKQMAPIFQLFSIYPINKLIGIASTKAVNAESWRGEIFLVKNIVRRYKGQVTRNTRLNRPHLTIKFKDY